MNNNPILKKKIFLYITEFLAGVAIMGVETAASRFLAPYFSSSQIIWTLIIGTILIAMSIGNVLGGKMADKHNNITRLYVLLLIAGSYICFIPFIGRYIITGVSAFFAIVTNNNLIVWATLSTCLILFVPPLMICGMVTPSLIKFSLDSSASNGKIVGTLEALSTIGSIIGTFIPTFISIPTIGTNATFSLFGGLIVLISVVYLFTGIFSNIKNINFIKSSAFPIIFLFFTIIGIILSFKTKFVFWKDKTLKQEDESIYNYLQIKEDEKSLYFSTNVMFGVQSMIKKDKSLTGMYYDICLAAPYMANYQNKKNTNMLILGNGTGTYATLVDKYIPSNKTITGVEIDKKIIDYSHKYFMMPENIKTVCDDGRSYINRDKNKYDVILVDAYSSISTPFQMSSVEFFNKIKNHLNDDGVMVMNINMKGNENDSLDKALSDTVCSSFKYVYKLPLPNATGDELFATNDEYALLKLKSAINSIDDYDLKTTMIYVSNNLKEYKDTGIRLTDDNADVEKRSMKAIDLIIQESLINYKKVYKEKGLRGLLDFLFN